VRDPRVGNARVSGDDLDRWAGRSSRVDGGVDASSAGGRLGDDERVAEADDGLLIEIWAAAGDVAEGPPPPRFENDVHHLGNEIAKLLLQRHAKYGPGNIANSPGGALNGILVRLHDKMSRLAHGLENHGDESVEDTLLDVAGYGLVGLLVVRKQWPSI
jgi:hypothetical protein